MNVCLTQSLQNKQTGGANDISLFLFDLGASGYKRIFNSATECVIKSEAAVVCQMACMFKAKPNACHQFAVYSVGLHNFYAKKQYSSPI